MSISESENAQMERHTWLFQNGSQQQNTIIKTQRGQMKPWIRFTPVAFHSYDNELKLMICIPLSVAHNLSMAIHFFVCEVALNYESLFTAGSCLVG
jgi:hypothetical protein